MMKTAVALFVYNRPEHTQQVLNGIRSGKVGKLFIFCDAPKDPSTPDHQHELVKGIIEAIDWCETEIFYSPANLGLARSIIGGVSLLLERHERIVVLEDDCVPADGYFDFMEQCFDRYQHDDQVMAISGYNIPITLPSSYAYDVYFSCRPCSWGWGTWRNRWEKFDPQVKGYEEMAGKDALQTAFNRGGNDMFPMLAKQLSAKLDSWAIRWCYSVFVHEGVCLYPTKSLISNIGFDGSGVHCSPTSKYDTRELGAYGRLNFPPDYHPDRQLSILFHGFYSSYSDRFVEFLSNASPKKIAIFGTGKLGLDTAHSLQNFSDYGSVGFFLDNDSRKWGGDFFGREVKQPSRELLEQLDTIVIASSWNNEIRGQLLELGVDPGKIVSVQNYREELAHVQTACERVFLGSPYGGWTICPSKISPESIVYSFGIGHDISFDLSLIERFGMRVHAFDPTPGSLQWLDSQTLPQELSIHDFGLADFDGTARFSPPENPEHISHTILDRPPTAAKSIEVTVLRLETIMNRLGHRKIDLLKMDIEGAEYGVLKDIISSRLEIDQLLVEFHHRFETLTDDHTVEAVALLNSAGFKIFNISANGEEFSFIRG
jgi:FkbM family methyltransferase